MNKVHYLIFGLLLLAKMPGTVLAQFTYITNNGAITITGYTGSGSGYLLIIPTNINGLPVTSISTNAFQTNAMSLLGIPNTVTNIGDYACADCPVLTTVEIQTNSIISIGSDAFYRCSSLENLDIFGTIRSIGDNAFYSCSSLSDIALPNGIQSIGNAAFGETDIFTFMIPASVTNISGNPFASCVRLTNISVATNNPNFASVGGVLFDYNQSTLIAYPTSITNNYYAIPNSALSVGYAAFQDCGNLTNISISANVSSIGGNAFFGCHGLTGLTIPYSVTNIGDAAFGYCFGITTIVVDTNNSSYTSLGEVLFTKDQSTLVEYPGGSSNNSYLIPNSVTNIGDYAFSGSYYLNSVTIGANVISIGNWAFYNCENLKNVIVPSGVTTIGNDSFFFCNGLTNVTLPYSLTGIGVAAFDSCESLRNIVIPGSVTNIGESAFQWCGNLTSVTIDEGVADIGSFAFGFCPVLTNIVIPPSVTNIGSYALYFDPKLTVIYFEGNAPTVGQFFAGPESTIYYLLAAVGWSSPFNGVPAALWAPAIRTTDGSFGIQSNQFGFDIFWASNESVTVHASSGLTSPSWTALTNVTLTNGLFYFSDANWTNFPGRYYRVSSP